MSNQSNSFEPLGEVKKIIIHHSTETFIGDVAANARILDIKAKNRGFEMISYHFVIGNGILGYSNINGTNYAAKSRDGGIEIGRPIDVKGAHAIPNSGAIGIALVGNFNRWLPTQKQMESLESLVLYLLYKFDLTPSDVLGHSEYQNTDKKCPGRNFNMTAFREKLESRFKPKDSSRIKSVSESVQNSIASTEQTLKLTG